jgi:hypothetical protein
MMGIGSGFWEREWDYLGTWLSYRERRVLGEYGTAMAFGDRWFGLGLVLVGVRHGRGRVAVDGLHCFSRCTTTTGLLIWGIQHIVGQMQWDLLTDLERLGIYLYLIISTADSLSSQHCMIVFSWCFDHLTRSGLAPVAWLLRPEMIIFSLWSKSVWNGLLKDLLEMQMRVPSSRLADCVLVGRCGMTSLSGLSKIWGTFLHLSTVKFTFIPRLLSISKPVPTSHCGYWFSNRPLHRQLQQALFAFGICSGSSMGA